MIVFQQDFFSFLDYFCFTIKKTEDRTILLGRNGTKKNFVVSDARIPRRIVSATLDAALFTS